MGTLSTQQTNEIANNFLALAQVIGDYRYQKFNELSEFQNQKIKDLHWSMLNYADDLYTVSATLVMNDIQNSLTLINSITIQIKATYTTIQNVQKAINVAAATATLGASILSKNPQAIADSIVELVDTWNS